MEGPDTVPGGRPENERNDPSHSSNLLFDILPFPPRCVNVRGSIADSPTCYLIGSHCTPHPREAITKLADVCGSGKSLSRGGGQRHRWLEPITASRWANGCTENPLGFTLEVDVDKYLRV